MQTQTINLRRGGRSGNRASRFFYPEGRTYSPPRRGGGISCGNRALSEGDAASAEAYGQCHSSGSMLSSSTQLSQTQPSM